MNNVCSYYLLKIVTDHNPGHLLPLPLLICFHFCVCMFANSVAFFICFLFFFPILDEIYSICDPCLTWPELLNYRYL